MAMEVGPALDLLKALGFNIKDTLIKWAKSRTMWFATMLTVFGAVQTYLPSFSVLIPAHWYGPIFGGIGIIVAVLRYVTTQPLSEK